MRSFPLWGLGGAASVLLTFPSMLLAQECGTRLTQRDVEVARERAAQEDILPPRALAASRKPVVIPVTFHIVRSTSGVGGLPPAQLTESLAFLNAGFEEVGLQFCTPGPTDFIDSTPLLIEIDSLSEIDLLRQTNSIDGTINIYFTEELSLGFLGLCGISSFTSHDVQGIVMRNSCAGSIDNPSTLAHEVGHYLDLFHTHETGLGVECPGGSNCDSAGDLLCDTPADPTLSSFTVSPQCSYVGQEPNPCGQPASYNPDARNFMAYGRPICREHFSPQQRSKMLATLFNLRPELVHEECPTVPTVPTDGLTRVSVSTDGLQADNFSGLADVAANGNLVVFASAATTLVDNPLDFGAQIYLRDRQSLTTMLLSQNQAGGGSNGNCTQPAISADGRHVVYESNATDISPVDAVFFSDIYRLDLQTGQTQVVSVTPRGTAGNNESIQPGISADGRVVVFASFASDLIPGDTNDMDVFARDMTTGQTTLVSTPFAGAPGQAEGLLPAVSPDGRFVVFASGSPNLTPGDTNGFTDVFMRDLVTGQTVMVSRTHTGGLADWHSERASVSDGGRFVAFESLAPNLSLQDAPGINTDIFVRDMLKDTLELISVSSAGQAGNGVSTEPDISADGRHVTFLSSSTNLVAGAGTTTFVSRVYRRDRLTGETILLSPGLGGVSIQLDCLAPAISADGQVVVYESPSGNLVPADSNFVTDVFAFDLSQPVAADLNGDGVVNGIDLGILLALWGVCTDPGAICSGDLNGDLAINGIDLGILLGSWTL